MNTQRETATETTHSTTIDQRDDVLSLHRAVRHGTRFEALAAAVALAHGTRALCPPDAVDRVMDAVIEFDGARDAFLDALVGALAALGAERGMPCLRRCVLMQREPTVCRALVDAMESLGAQSQRIGLARCATTPARRAAA